MRGVRIDKENCLEYYERKEYGQDGERKTHEDHSVLPRLTLSLATVPNLPYLPNLFSCGYSPYVYACVARVLALM